jgi:hypothetical protein
MNIQVTGHNRTRWILSKIIKRGDELIIFSQNVKMWLVAVWFYVAITYTWCMTLWERMCSVVTESLGSSRFLHIFLCSFKFQHLTKLQLATATDGYNSHRPSNFHDTSYDASSKYTLSPQSNEWRQFKDDAMLIGLLDVTSLLKYW